MLNLAESSNDFLHKIRKMVKVLDCLNIDYKHLENKQKLHKIFYILSKNNIKVFKKFNWEYNGVYSPDLNKITLKHIDEIINNDTILKNKELETIKKFKNNKFIHTLLENEDKLNYYANLLFVNEDMVFFSENKKQKMKNVLSKLKKDSTNFDFDLSVKKLTHLNCV